MRRMILIISSLLIGAVLFAGGASESGKTTVEIWHSNAGIAGNAFEEIVDDFNSTIGEEKGIVIEPIYQGAANDVLTKVKAAATADRSSIPDIAQLDATACLDMKNADYLILPQDINLDTSYIMPSAIEALMSDRGLLGIPFNASSLLFFYNKTLFDSLSLDPPETLADFAEIAPLLGEKDSNGKITRYAFAGVPATYELGTFIGAQNGLSYFVDMQNGHMGTPEKVLLEDEGTFRNFLVHWKNLYDTGWVNNITSGISTEFAAGRTATMLSSSSDIASVIKNVGGRFEVGTAFVPKTDENATGGVNIGGGSFFIFTPSDAVRTVLEYFISENVQLKWAEETGYMPINTDLYDNPDYLSFLSENPQFKVAMDQTEASNPKVTSIWLPSAYQIYYSFQSTIRAVTEDGMDIDAAVHEMASIIQKAIDEYRAQNIQ